MSDSTFRVGISRDFLTPAGHLPYPDIGLGLIQGLPGIEWEFFPEHRLEVTPEQIAAYDAVVSLSPRYTPASFAGSGGRLALLCRFGVGWDNVDTDACTAAGVAVTITRGAASRPVAESIVTLLLALGHRLLQKDRLTRAGQWEARAGYTGIELRDRVLGSIGFGGIARELFRLLEPFGLRRCLTTDPYVDPSEAAARGVEVVPLESLLRQADYVVVNCPLTPETQGLVGARELGLMRPDAFLVNSARGGVVDQAALTSALQAGRLRGAALDVFAVEPVAPDDPLLALENVIVTPHSLSWTEELFRDYGRMAFTAVRQVYRGELPDHVVNETVLTSSAFREKLGRFADRHARS